MSLVVDKVEKLGDGLGFSDFVSVLEKTTALKKIPEKNKKIEGLLTKCRNIFLEIHGTLDSDSANGDSIYPIIRLLLSQYERERPAYGVQTHTLGRLLADSIGLSGIDRDRLIHFKDPVKAEANVGDFATIAYSVMKSRFSDSAPSKLSITEIHEILDRFAAANLAEKKTILIELFATHKISALEGKWIVRILLKKLETGVKTPKILEFIHPQAKDYIERISDLKKLCQTLNDPQAVIDAGEIRLNYFVKPMLALRTVDLSDFDFRDDGNRPSTSKSRKSDKTTKMAPPYVVETKWDGERFQIHYDGNKLKYMSRRAHDFTKNFDKTFTPGFRPQLRQGVKSFIIDGEMMAWNKRCNIFTQKGAVDIDVKTFTVNNQTHCPVFVAFDVLLYNGDVVIDKPLHQRVDILKKMITPKEGVVVITEQKILQTRHEVEEALNTAIDNCDEGLIVKSIDSKYEPAKRGLFWRKVKPEFLSGGSVSDLDLLILGAYYSDSARGGGQVSKFLVGIISDDGKEYFPLTSVGSGKLRNAEMGKLLEKLNPLFVKKEFPSVRHIGRKRPDLFIDPKKSVVLQVKASEITASDVYLLQYTLRFPRVTKIREDKRYNQVMTVSEFHDLRVSSKGKLVKRTDGKISSSSGSTYRKRKKSSETESDNDYDVELSAKRNSPTKISAVANSAPPKIFSHLKPKLAASSTTLAASTHPDIFKSKVFCIYGSPTWKDEMEKIISSHGGVIVQSPNLKKEKVWIVGESEKTFKVQTAMKSSLELDIFKPTWITKCIDQKAEVAFAPRDFYKYSSETAAIFANDFDEYGDSYKEVLSLPEVKELVGKVKNWKSPNAEPDSPEDTSWRKDLEKELFTAAEKFRFNERYNFFRDTKIAFKGPFDDVLAAYVQFYGGEIASNNDENEGVTHVIVTPTDIDSSNYSSSASVWSAFTVKPNWITDCIKKRQMLVELPYLAK